MGTLTIELTDELAARLAAASERQKVSPAQIVQAALEKALREQTASSKETASSRSSALDGLHDLVACFDSGVTDLATNPKYLEGFGQ
jgi:predicted transcriptional regulator